MARGKKKEFLTPEERLQAALVPESEQPYKVPGNWCWVHLLDSFYNYTDSKKKIPQKEYMKDGDIAVVDQGQDLVGGYTNDSEKVFTGDLPVIIFGDHTRCIKYIDFPFVQGADGVKVLKPKQFFDTKAFYYAFQNVNIPNMGYRRHFPLFDQHAIPLPPITEQQRIVDRIESLFTKLDEAKQKAQDALDSFETRKAAILHKAFTGELTAQWRKERGVGMESWDRLQWGSFIASIEAGKNWNAEGRPPRADEFGVVKVSAVTWGEFNEVESKTCTVEEQWNENVQIHEGDFLFSRANTLQLVGNCVIVKYISRRLMLSDKILRFKFDKRVIPEYVLHFTRSNLYRNQIEQLASGNQDGMRNVSQKNMKLVKFPIPKFEEQKEIVSILSDLLAKEEQAKGAAEEVLEQINLIKKAILDRAFRGELGTNDPSEESAIKLLERSFSGTIEIEKVKTKQVAKQKAEVIFVSKTIMEALSKGVRLTPENLKSETELPIDDFYARLKELIDNGSVVESRENGESYLEAGNENRQAENQ